MGFHPALPRSFVGVVLRLPVALALILVAVSLFLLRSGIPLDLAFLIVAVVVIAVSLLLLRWALRA
jgi:hypothetical protein